MDVWRTWRKHGLKPHQIRRLNLSRDPKLVEMNRSGSSGDPRVWELGATSHGKRHSSELRARAIRMFVELGKDHDSPWGAIRSISEKVGRRSETLGHPPQGPPVFPTVGARPSKGPTKSGRS